MEWKTVPLALNTALGESLVPHLPPSSAVMSFYFCSCMNMMANLESKVAVNYRGHSHSPLTAPDGPHVGSLLAS